MNKLFLSLFLCAVFLTACATNPEPLIPDTTAPTEATENLTTSPAPVTTEDTIAPTEPAHSAIYIPGVEAEDVVEWFNEVCLAAEYIQSGDPSFLQKWDGTIFYMIHGAPTQEDRATLETFSQWLNTLEGFPGIKETTDPQEANLNIYFCSLPEMRTLMGDWANDLDGAVTFWYEYDRIYDATICIRTDLNQHLRNSVILEELYNGLGPIQDTSLRPDSIIYVEFSEPQQLTQIDELILRLLYHPQMQFGMDAAQCEAVIRCLYY